MSRNQRRLTLDKLDQAIRHLTSGLECMVIGLEPYFARFPDKFKGVQIAITSIETVQEIINKIKADI